MLPLMPAQTVLTANSAANDLQARGLEAMGLAAPALSPLWAGSNPAQGDYDPTALTLRLASPRAPFMGIATWLAAPAIYSDVSGQSVTGPAFALTLHPEAARRLQVLVDLRTGSNVYPVPVAMLLRGIAPPSPLPPPQIYLAGETLDDGTATVSFHDARGLPIDPIAMAHLWNDLMVFRAALQNANTFAGTPADPGGIGSMLGFAAGDLCHVVDPHGWRYQGTRPAATLRVLNGAGDAVRDLAADSLETLAAGETFGRSNADIAAVPANTVPPLRWGFARNGTLGQARLSAPALPATVGLGRRFFRIMAVDLDWHILGNRTMVPIASVAGAAIPAEDGGTPPFLHPVVRDRTPGFAYLADGVDVLGAMAAMTQGFGNPNDQLFAAAVSPALDPAVLAPPAPGAQWPAFPPAAATSEIVQTADPRQGLTASWRAPGDGPGAVQDVVLTVDGSQLPLGAHLRAYPRRFVEIASIGEQPSFVRGDGGATIVQGGPARLLLVNPFGLSPAEPHPSPAILIVDLVVVSRSGRRRMYSGVRLEVAAGPDAFVPDTSFGGVPLLAPGTLVATILDGFMTRSIAPVPAFGLPRPPASAGPPTSLTELLRRLASDEQPRQGPRLPTQARFDTQFVIGVSPAPPAGNPNLPYDWQAVTTGARLTPESRHARPELANAGHPAGPDVFASGTAFSGALARDAALHAIKRAQPIFIPTGGANFRGWLATTMDDKWNDPPGPPPGGTVAAAVLETIAPFCDTPELAAAPAPQPGATLQNLINQIAADLGIQPPTVTLGNEQRVVPIVQREIATARSGQRDALWSLVRAIGQARELIYVEGPAFARTSRPDGPPRPDEIDLVSLIAARMAANPRLKLILCVPREGDFARERPHWTVTALRHRREALADLISVDPRRVAAFHPIGYPGRAAAIRTTTVIVDDVYCLNGTSHFRRRGMTFDGGLDVASIDTAIGEGYSAGIANFRQRLMAAKLGVNPAATVAAATALWIRLAKPESAFDVVFDLLAGGGAGRLQPIWAGAEPDNIIPQSDAVVDPDGVDTDSFLQLFAALIVEG
ncbi:hypothetical protein [Neoaquamicrobium sediminum]|uniref:hypothetical protein n=1 Tax=Neoaquamicrobium sediminum TaxID=1849104 RepID=UPI00361E4CAC